jgi:hypothetical protein
MAAVIGCFGVVRTLGCGLAQMACGANVLWGFKVVTDAAC